MQTKVTAGASSSRDDTVGLFRRRLEAVLARTAASPAAFARRAGIDRSTLSQLMTDDAPRLPRAETLIAIAKAAHVSVDWLLGLSQREEVGAEIIEAMLQIETPDHLPADDHFMRWLNEADGYRIRTVPMALPDFMKTEAVLRLEYAGAFAAAAPARLDAVRARLDFMCKPDHDVEVSVALQSLWAFAGGQDLWHGLPAEGERALEVGAIETQGMISLGQVTGCDVTAPQAGEPRFPIMQWEKSGLRGIIISGPGECAQDVVLDDRPLFANEPTFALTFDAAESAEIVERVTKGTRARVLSAQAGLFPVLEATLESDAELIRYVDSFAVRPTWWAALGRDAGLLAHRAVSPLPTEGATDVREVTQRRSIVVGGLMATRGRLWTTEAEGFGQNRTIPRTLSVLEWPKK